MNQQQLILENELDIQKLWRLLWCGKLWISSCGLFFALCALLGSYLITPEWISEAIITKPSLTELGSYYKKYTELDLLSRTEDYINTSSEMDKNLIGNEVYTILLQQLLSYDTKRDFWLANDYYLKRCRNNEKEDAKLLETYIDNILIVADDNTTPTNVSIKLTAETSSEAQHLLTEYLNFAKQRATKLLKNELITRYTNQQNLLQLRLKHIITFAAIQLANNNNPSQKSARSNNKQDQEKEALFSDKELSTLDRNTVLNYKSTKLAIEQINQSLDLNDLQPYQLLKSPNKPITLTKPHRVVLTIVWGIIGAFCGTIIALTRHPKQEKTHNDSITRIQG